MVPVPLFLFNQFGDLERCVLRSGNVHSADDWESVLKPVLVRYKGRKVPCLGTYFGKSCGGSMNCDDRPQYQPEGRCGTRDD